MIIRGLSKWEMLENSVNFIECENEADEKITEYMALYSCGCRGIDALIERIQKEGIADIAFCDYFSVLRSQSRPCFAEMVDNLDEIICTASEKYRSMFPEIRLKYKIKLGNLTKAIAECSPNNQYAQQLAAAINRLDIEVWGAMNRGIDCYVYKHRNPKPADLLSDTRHGALWDSVENAIIALSTAQDETKADICAAVRAEVRAEVRGLKSKSDAKEMKRRQRERAARWLITKKTAGCNASIVDAARHFVKDVAAEKSKGGYKNTNTLLSALNRCADELGIAQFITRRKK